MGTAQFKLGQFIRERRKELGLSAREVARRADVNNLPRIEAGTISPETTTLAAIAAALEVELTDLLAVMGSAKPSPALQLSRPYLRTKHRDLPDEALTELDRYVARLRRKHGLQGPQAGEDER